MRNRRRNREAFREHSYWQSYSDMLAALLLIFILMIAITLAIYRQKTNDLEQTRLELDSAQSELDATIKDLELSNEELASSLAELQQANEQEALTQEELNRAYLEIEKCQGRIDGDEKGIAGYCGDPHGYHRCAAVGFQQFRNESGCPDRFHHLFFRCAFSL